MIATICGDFKMPIAGAFYCCNLSIFWINRNSKYSLLLLLTIFIRFVALSAIVGYCDFSYSLYCTTMHLAVYVVRFIWYLH